MEPPKSIRRTGLTLFLGMISIASAAAQPVITGPKVDAILFTPDALILSVPSTAQDGQATESFFRFDRKSAAIQRLDSLPPNASGVTVSRVMLDAGDNPSSVKSSPSASAYLLTGDGEVYLTSAAPCVEAAMRDPSLQQVHYAAALYSTDCKPVSTPLKQPEYVTAVENYRDFLLIGTMSTDFSRGAAIPQPDRGMLVVSKKDGRLVRSVTQKDGLSENLIELIRQDPDTGGLWVETPRALAELSTDFTVQQVFFLHLVLDPVSGAPTLAAGTDPEYDDPYALLATRLHLRDYAAYARAVAQLTPKMRKQIVEYIFASSVPLPADLNPLLPFFAESALNDAADLGPSFARDNLCRFHDPRTRDAADRLIKAALPPGSKNAAMQNWMAVHACASSQATTASSPCPVGSTLPYPQCVMPGSAGQTHVVRMGGTSVRVDDHYGAMTAANPEIMTRENPGGITTGVFGAAARIQGSMLMTISLSPPFFYWDGKRTLQLKDVTFNDGPATAPPSVTRYYLSSTAPVDPNTARVLAQRSLGPIPGLQADSGEMDVQLPADLPHGIYYLAACPDADHDVARAAEEGRCVIPLPSSKKDYP